MVKQIVTLFEYEKWANARILSALEELEETDEKSLDIMAHILLVPVVWHSRISNIPAPAIWAKKSLTECSELNNANIRTLSPYFESLTESELHRMIQYRNTGGVLFSNTVSDILHHVFNHGTYHRGQIVERIKGKLKQMPVTDMIVFLRGK